MLTCRWCGLRPTEEFASLDEVVACGVPADSAAEGTGEWWWHRLGCGRPFVVRLTPAPYQGTLPDVDRANRSPRLDPLEAGTTVLAVGESTEEGVDVVELEALDADPPVTEDPRVAAVQVEDLQVEGAEVEDLQVEGVEVVDAEVVDVELEDAEVEDGDADGTGTVVGDDPAAEGPVDAEAPAGVRTDEPTDSPEVDALVEPDVVAVPDGDATVIDLTELEAVAVAGIFVDLVGEPPVDYERPIGAPGEADGPDALIAAAEAQVAPGGEAPFSFNLLVQASPPAAAEGDEDDGGIGWGEEDSVSDRFRPSLRRDGAQELSRRTIRPMPARPIGGRVPRQVQVARRPAVIYGAPFDEGSAPGADERGDEAVESPLAAGDQWPSDLAPTDRVEAEAAGVEGPDDPTPAVGDVPEDASSSSLFARVGRGARAGSAPASTEAVSDASFAGALHEALAEPPPPRPSPSPAARRSGLFEVPPSDGDEAGDE